MSIKQKVTTDGFPVIDYFEKDSTEMVNLTKNYNYLYTNTIQVAPGEEMYFDFSEGSDNDFITEVWENGLYKTTEKNKIYYINETSNPTNVQFIIKDMKNNVIEAETLSFGAHATSFSDGSKNPNVSFNNHTNLDLDVTDSPNDEIIGIVFFKDFLVSFLGKNNGVKMKRHDYDGNLLSEISMSISSPNFFSPNKLNEEWVVFTAEYDLTGYGLSIINVYTGEIKDLVNISDIERTFPYEDPISGIEPYFPIIKDTVIVLYLYIEYGDSTSSMVEIANVIYDISTDNYEVKYQKDYPFIPRTTRSTSIESVSVTNGKYDIYFLDRVELLNGDDPGIELTYRNYNNVTKSSRFTFTLSNYYDSIEGYEFFGDTDHIGIYLKPTSSSTYVDFFILEISSGTIVNVCEVEIPPGSGSGSGSGPRIGSSLSISSGSDSLSSSRFPLGSRVSYNNVLLFLDEKSISKGEYILANIYSGKLYVILPGFDPIFITDNFTYNYGEFQVKGVKDSQGNKKIMFFFERAYNEVNGDRGKIIYFYMDKDNNFDPSIFYNISSMSGGGTPGSGSGS